VILSPLCSTSTTQTTYIFTLTIIFQHPAPTEFSTLSLHDALPICSVRDHVSSRLLSWCRAGRSKGPRRQSTKHAWASRRSCRREIGRDTSELQSRGHLVCRLLLEKKKRN